MNEFKTGGVAVPVIEKDEAKVDHKIVGKPIPIVDGKEKVTGQAQFVNDIKLPGMLIAKILRSPYPHARVINIDTTLAENLPGVKAVITRDDTRGEKYIAMGPPLSDRYPLVMEKAKYIGDEIAAVAAVNESIAEEALRLIKVNYEVLPAVYEPEEAVKEDAPVIHEDRDSNIAMRIARSYGDPDSAFQAADYVFSDTYVTQVVSHAILEPKGTVAHYFNGKVTIWTSTQAPYFVRKEVAHILGMPEGDVRVKEIFSAGAFGARSKVCDDEAICALLSRKALRPVKLVLTREEEFKTTRVRHPYHIDIRTGVSREGRLLAREVKMVVDNGAYNYLGPAVLGYSTFVAASHYKVENIKIDASLVYTNKQAGTAFRGFGSPQVTFAIESQMDDIADQLGFDRLAFRLLNAHESGFVTPAGWKITSCGMKECLQKAYDGVKDLPLDSGSKVKKRGIGLASSIHISGVKLFKEGDYSGAIVRVAGDGTVTVFTGAADVGTGSKTTLVQVAAEALGVSVQKVSITTMDTDQTPQDIGSWASRIMFVGGNAVLRAAKLAREQIIKTAGAALNVDPEDLDIDQGVVFARSNRAKAMPIGDAVKLCNTRIGDWVMGSYHYDTPAEMINRQSGVANISPTYSYGAHGALVEVDEETGMVEVLRIVAAHDVGKAINPMIVEGQVLGALAQGIGYALTEQMLYKDGKLLNGNFLDYKILTTADMPQMEVSIVETMDEEGPFGAKGIGEPGLIPTAAAIANAIKDATGVRFKEIPILPEHIVEALSPEDI
ncbi:MAG: molybdopterin cofactor-binding domain-containing protein [Bacillota bacterium]